ncbi:coiled-coil domain-containing protein 174 [Cylas formicarius]|uniref:coiled-coil domain-containing protein 174 n=1 Tax=Cylas formicarius TaxID=197179 RepID=UPI002958BDC6|nr:coiled-coil domain-containing protein 174 [Cylas formicarius]
MSTYEISKSSLLSLKAEILRKQEELTKAKVENDQKIKVIKKNNPLEFKNKGVEERGSRDLSEEDLDLLKLSSARLEAKATLYEKLTNDSNQSNDLGNRYLVRFDKKNPVKRDQVSVHSSDDETHFSDEYESPSDPSEEWVEYVDCLGRSRKCLRKDLEYLKSKDAELKVIAEERKQSRPVEKEIENVVDVSLDTDLGNNMEPKESELISGDMRRDMLRRQWEKEEDELMNRTNVHYQNVLFNEARTHGVGYYAFSKDEEKRERQLEALKSLRKETERQQNRAQYQKALREKQLAARMKAARNRKRARMGLPPEEDEPVSKSDDKELENIENNEEEKKKFEEAEKLREQARRKHVRPWDIGKEGAKEHYEMSQTEWNEKKRGERIAEFAPPSVYQKKRDFHSSKVTDISTEENMVLKFTSKKKKINSPSINPYKTVIIPDEESEFSRGHSSTKDPTIVDESTNESANIEESVDAGLKFLRRQAEQKICESPW